MFTMIEANQGDKSLFQPGSGFIEKTSTASLKK